jgi:hypothetical protein
MCIRDRDCSRYRHECAERRCRHGTAPRAAICPACREAGMAGEFHFTPDTGRRCGHVHDHGPGAGHRLARGLVSIPFRCVRHTQAYYDDSPAAGNHRQYALQLLPLIFPPAPGAIPVRLTIGTGAHPPASAGMGTGAAPAERLTPVSVRPMACGMGEKRGHHRSPHRLCNHGRRCSTQRLSCIPALPGCGTSPGPAGTHPEQKPVTLRSR